MRLTAQNLPSVLAVALFALMFAFGSFSYTGFFAGQVFLNLLIDNAFVLIVAVGMTFVILSGGIDLSVGSIVALTTMALAWGVERAHVPAWVMVPVLLVGGTLFGAGMGCVIQFFRIPAFIVTLAGMFLARGLCYLISIDSIAINDPALTAWSQLRIPVGPLGQVSPGVVIAVAVGIVLAHRTAFGRNVYAIGGNERSALLMGLPVAPTRIAVYALSGFCATLGGVVFGIYTLSGYGLHALGLELDAIAAAVIGGVSTAGGVGTVAGMLTGVLIFQVLDNGLVILGVSPYWQQIVKGTIIVAAVAIDIRKYVTRK